MDAIELLEQQHRDVEDLFDDLFGLDEEDHDGRREAFHRLADAVAAHATIEEQLFYPAIKPVDADRVWQSLEEHLALKRVMVDLLKIDPDDESFDPKLEVMRELFDHHIMEEEHELFPEVKRRLGSHQRSELGDEMESMFESMRGDEPRHYVLEQLEGAPPA